MSGFLREDVIQQILLETDGGTPRRAPWWLIQGEAGSGKSTLVGEVYNRLKDSGKPRTFLSTVPDAENSLPYQAVASLFYRLLNGEGPEGRDKFLSALPPAGRGAVEQLLYQRGATPEQPHGTGWFFLFEALCDLLRAFTEGGPALFILDDAHKLDPSSAYLIQELQRETLYLPILWILTRRTVVLRLSEETESALLTFATFPRTRECALAPLSTTQVRELCRLRGVVPGEERLEELLSLSGGNPLYLQELLRADGGEKGGNLTLLIAEELRKLPRAAVETICRAALLGQESSLPDLEAAAGIESEELLRHMSIGRDAGLLELSPGDGGVAFRHEVVRRAFLDGFDPLELAQRREECARRLEAFYGPDAEKHAEILAQLYRNGHTRPAYRRGAEYLLITTRRAARSLAWAEARQRASTLLDDAAEYLDEQMEVEALKLRGEAAYKLGDRYPALQDLKRAFDAYAGKSAHQAMMRLLLVATYIEIGDVELVEMARRAVYLFPAGSPEHLLCRIYYGSAIYHALGEYREGTDLVKGVIKDAASCSLPQIENLARAIFVQCALGAGREREAEDELTRLETAEPLPFFDPRPYVHYARAQVLMRQGNHRGARAFHEAALANARETGDESLLGPVLQMAARNMLWLGKWDEAESLAAAGIRYNRYATGVYVPLIVSCYQRGQVERGDRHLTELKGLTEQLPASRGTARVRLSLVIALRRLITRDSSWDRLARDYAREIVEGGMTHPHAVVRAGFALGELALATYLETGTTDPRELELAEKALMAGEEYTVLQRHYLEAGFGIVAWCRGDTGRARAHMETALREAELRGDLPSCCWLHFWLGKLTGDGEPQKARERTEKARALAQELGIPHIERGTAHQLLLTPREQEVLELCARGLIAKEIAAELGIRLPTVHNHIHRVLKKTESGNRIEAIRWARSAGLISPS